MGIRRCGQSWLGRLVNRITPTDRCEPWTFGVGALMRNLARRGVLGG
jgi:fumarylacetoacetate (FAA) hydrolase family protein